MKPKTATPILETKQEVGVITRQMNRAHKGRLFTALLAMSICILGASFVQANTAVINHRPLTTQELTDYSLPAGTQIANGTRAVGVGGIAYLEVLVVITNEEPVTISDVTLQIDGVWNDDGDPVVSAAALQDSPLGSEVPTYDPGDVEDAVIALRKVLVPDVKGAYGISGQVTLSTGEIIDLANWVIGSNFIGKDGVCTVCHDDKLDPAEGGEFNVTDHAIAFTNQINGFGSSHFNPNCISCHVVGYDKTEGAVNGGWDDVQLDTGWEFPAEFDPSNWDNMPAELQNVSNIQCENCHGPAQDHFKAGGDPQRIGISMSGGNCGQCHDAKTHHIKNAEWENSGHGGGHYAHHYIGRNGCQDCHTGAGFAASHDDDYTDKDIRATGNEGISCAACHDPHVPGSGEHQLRVMNGAPLGNGTVLTDGGDGLLCMNCHQSRRDAIDYVEGYTGGTFRGPHHGPQGDMMAGENAYEFGKDLPSSSHLKAIEHSCVTCHMQETEDASSAHLMAGGHTWKMSYDGGTPEDPADDIHLTEACAECHGELEDFNFGGEDYNRNGIVEGVQAEIAGLVHILEAVLPAGSPNCSWSVAERGAYYNLHFIEEDGSHGVHNPKYAAALLQSAIGAVTGGIDVDCDGLLDDYEMQEFGDLSSQTGASDADDDGVSNALEKALGTNPNKADTDDDGFTDLAELEAGSDPLDPASMPDPSAMMLVPAIEMGYMPSAPGLTLQFQAIDTLGAGGTWMNLGDSMLSTEAPAWQLFSTRDDTQYYFRVIEQ